MQQLYPQIARLADPGQAWASGAAVCGLAASQCYNRANFSVA
ncbi:hypothetical protein LHK_00346 [Laribacter hongkongensis HLHK9]|uniref:Uncharacterized protein n=1 Tax=Laribacter hongkongensis (strain HLHK9) TaxID=557598 RepID=C1DBE4_LARHH|nr:hypothetical protein LHK_00346 [Laribacter hongkongensis HLHK9]